MKKVFISLGSGCEIALVLNQLGLRKQSMPFDWLWNFDGGLRFVTNILSDSFVQFSDRNNLLYQNHYRWNKPMLILRPYPTLAHIHSNPLSNESEFKTLLRRVDRFKTILEQNDEIIFFYYRSTEEYNLKNPGKYYDIASCLSLQLEESCAFINFLKNQHPMLNFRLISICQLPYIHYKPSVSLLNDFENYHHEHLTTNITFLGSETNNLKSVLPNIHASYSWFHVFYQNRFITISLFIKVLFQTALKLILKASKNSFLK